MKTIDSRLPRVLFICVRNSARSQMAEAFLNSKCAGRIAAESAGLEPGEINPLAVASMREVGIDISKNATKSVFHCFKSGKLYSYVVTVCDETSAEKCPIFPGVVQRIHWSIADPAALGGTWEERLFAVRAIRDEIRRRVEAFCEDVCPLLSAL
jgi:arsenate reductase (thioredoxin)